MWLELFSIIIVVFGGLYTLHYIEQNISDEKRQKYNEFYQKIAQYRWIIFVLLGISIFVSFFIAF